VTTPSVEISLRTSSVRPSLRTPSVPARRNPPVLEGVLVKARSYSLLLRPLPAEVRRNVRGRSYLLLLLLPSIGTVYLLLGLLSFLLGKG
jgi:hypothetical protein